MAEKRKLNNLFAPEGKPFRTINWWIALFVWWLLITVTHILFFWVVWDDTQPILRVLTSTFLQSLMFVFFFAPQLRNNSVPHPGKKEPH